MSQPPAQRLLRLFQQRTGKLLIWLGLISLMGSNSPAFAQSLETIARDFVDWHWSQNPLPQLMGQRCNQVLEGTSFAPNRENCNRLRNLAYQYWRSTYGPSGPRYP